MSPRPLRRPTGELPPREKTSSFKITATKPPRQTKSPTLKEDEVVRYNLYSEDLKKWLENRFKEHKFEGKSIVLKGDNWMIMVPEELTEDEKEDIYKLRRAPAPAPDPGH